MSLEKIFGLRERRTRQLPVIGGLDPALQRDGSFVTPPLTLRWYKKTVPQSRLYRGPGDGIPGPHAITIAWGLCDQKPSP